MFSMRIKFYVVNNSLLVGAHRVALKDKAQNKSELQVFVFLFLFLNWAQSICPTCTAAYRLIVQP
jgi:hypothetical protein